MNRVRHELEDISLSVYRMCIVLKRKIMMSKTET